MNRQREDESWLATLAAGIGDMPQHLVLERTPDEIARAAELVRIVQAPDGDASRASMWLQEFRSYATPLHAFGALAEWPRGKPLPDDLYEFFRDASRAIFHSALLVAVNHKNTNDALGGAMQALGLTGRSVKGSDGNAFAAFRDYWRDKRIAEKYASRRAAGEKSTAIYAALAEEHNVDEATIKRRIARGRKAAAGAKP